VGLFNRSKDDSHDPWAHGIQTTAVVERVNATGLDLSSGNETSVLHEVYVIFRLTMPDGAEVLLQRELAVGTLPRPGAVVEVAYVPDQLETSLDFNRHQMAAVDDSVPRGWSGGYFGSSPIGPYPAIPTLSGLDEERSLFRDGVPVEAEVVKTKFGMLLERHGSVKCKLTLRVVGGDGAELVKEFWADPVHVPHTGDHIKIVMGSDGSLIAIDPAERFYNPPGRAFVWTTPAKVALLRDGSGSVEARLTQLEKMVETGKLTAGQFAVLKDQIQPPERPAAPAVPGNPALTRQLEILAMSHKAGKLSDEKYEQLRSDILRYNG
jgi:hypothetical protein